MIMDRYDPAREITGDFGHRRLPHGSNERGEVPRALRYLRVGGQKTSRFVAPTRPFATYVTKIAPAAPDVVVFRQPQLPLRGRVNDAFVGSALTMCPMVREYTYSGLGTGVRNWILPPGSRKEVARRVAGRLGSAPHLGIAVGPLPRLRATPTMSR